MKVGITVWGKRISPVFDVARTLQIISYNEGQPYSSELLYCTPRDPVDMARIIINNRVDVLITGAISGDIAELIRASGIRLIPFIAGRVEQVLSTYLEGGSFSTYRMPGCWSKEPTHLDRGPSLTTETSLATQYCHTRRLKE